MALLGADRERFEALLRHLVGDADHRIEHEGHAACDDFGERRRVAAERDVGHLGPRERLDERAGQVRRAAVAGRSIGNLAGPGFGRLHHVLRGIERRVGLGDHHQGQEGHQADRREVLDRVVRLLVGHQDRVHVVRERRHEQCVAVGRRALYLLRRDKRVGAGLVLHHHALRKRARHVLRDDARDHVGGPARGEADQQLDRLGGIALRVRACAHERSSAAQQRRDANRCQLAVHDASLKKRVAMTWQRLM